MDCHWPDLIQRLNGGAETAMDTEDLAVNDGREGEVVEDLCAVPPHLVQKVSFWQLGLLWLFTKYRDAPVFSQALVIEAINLRYFASKLWFYLARGA